VVVYCLGPDLADNHGNLSYGASLNLSDGQDVGFQLWGPASRR
jgi:hypothetical protein